MADAAYIQSKIYYGYGQAAKRIGLQFDIYRSATPINPIVPLNIISNGFVSFNVSWNYEKANKYANAVWQTLINANSISNNGTDAKVGDYLKGTDLKGNTQIFFIIAQQTLLPILSVECNKTVTIERASQEETADSNNYSGYIPTSVTILAQNLPVSILYQNQGVDNKMRLPTDTRLPRWTMLLPNLGAVIYKNRDIVIDEINMRYVIVSVESTDFGWRMVLEQLGA